LPHKGDKSYRYTRLVGIFPVSLKGNKQSLGLNQPRKELQALEEVVVRLGVQICGGGCICANQHPVEECARDHVRDMLGQRCHECTRSIVQGGVGSFALQTLFQIPQGLGGRHWQHGHNAILQDIDKRGQAEKSHDAEALRLLAKTVVARNGACSRRNCFEILLAILFRNLVHTRDSRVLVTHIFRFPDDSCQLGQEGKQ
jgi:hypothetical protein